MQALAGDDTEAERLVKFVEKMARHLINYKVMVDHLIEVSGVKTKAEPLGRDATAPRGSNANVASSVKRWKEKTK